jgi:hypothetical protein
MCIPLTNVRLLRECSLVARYRPLIARSASILPPSRGQIRTRPTVTGVTLRSDALHQGLSDEKQYAAHITRAVRYVVTSIRNKQPTAQVSSRVESKAARLLRRSIRPQPAPSDHVCPGPLTRGGPCKRRPRRTVCRDPRLHLSHTSRRRQLHIIRQESRASRSEVVIRGCDPRL